MKNFIKDLTRLNNRCKFKIWKNTRLDIKT